MVAAHTQKILRVEKSTPEEVFSSFSARGVQRRIESCLLLFVTVCAPPALGSSSVRRHPSSTTPNLTPNATHLEAVVFATLAWTLVWRTTRVCARRVPTTFANASSLGLLSPSPCGVAAAGRASSSSATTSRVTCTSSSSFQNACARRVRQ